jgi:formylglycine-generating enzyme required for sulfatase activity
MDWAEMAPRIFLAHAREDKPQVRTLYADLKACGLDPWLDEVDLVPGQIWKVEIPKAIREAEMFLACLSRRSVEKRGYVHQELREALSVYGERPPGSIYIIPVRLDECDVPDLQTPDRGLSLKDIHWVDLWQEGGFDRLVNAIWRVLEVATPPQAAREEALTAIPSPEQVTERRAEQTQAEPAEAKLWPGNEPKSGTVFRDIEALWCPELVVIPQGKFMMGSPSGEEGRSRDEGPQHDVTFLRPFALGRCPVTFDQYDHFCAQTKREEAEDEGWGRGQRPVINVSWDDAEAYSRWLSRQTWQTYRLPSEAEWEYACRAGTTTRSWWGDIRLRRTTEIGSYPPNPWGLCDMYGNVWEWVEDCWDDSYEGAPKDGSAWMRGDCSRRVLRGGSWGSEPEYLRSAYRLRIRTDYRNYGIGFRVARTLR